MMRWERREGISIPARVIPDFNRGKSSTFDCTPWFEQATVKEIVALATCGNRVSVTEWGGCHDADAVALYCEDCKGDLEGISELKKVLTYLRLRDEFEGDEMNGGGYEVYVDGSTAMTWLKKNRKKVFEAVSRSMFAQKV